MIRRFLARLSAYFNQKLGLMQVHREPLPRKGGDPAIFSNLAFDHLGLDTRLKKGLKAVGYILCTHIQAAVLPKTLKGQDVIGQAETGSGKTAAFLVTLGQNLLHAQVSAPEPYRPYALIIAPTRELAMQIEAEANALYRFMGLSTALLVGGLKSHAQEDALAKGVDVVIGTPGRLIDFMRQRFLSLSNIRVVILDEADRMFDLGFLRDIRYILRQCPDVMERQTMLFSATLGFKEQELAYEHMNKPHFIKTQTIQGSSVKERITHRLYMPSAHQKSRLLRHFLETENPTRTVIFANTKKEVHALAALLGRYRYRVVSLAGDVPQKERFNLLKQFKEGHCDILVATDVAARGLDIPLVSHVFNYDLPDNPSDFIHRVGRTARIGHDGIAVSFACERYAMNLPAIESLIGHALPVISLEGIQLHA